MLDFWGGNRVCAIDGSVNFRDVGGYRAIGGSVRTRTIYRSAHLTHFAPAGIDLLAKEVGIRTVIDLRSREEVDKGLPGYDAAGIRHVHFPIGNGIMTTQEERDRIFATLIAGTFDWPGEYARLVRDEAPAFAAAMAHLAVPETVPAVIHCAAGRDRTGVTIAILLGALGVSRDDIIADYAATGELLSSRLDLLLTPGEQALVNDDAFRAMVGTPPEYMATFLQHLEDTYGSIAGALTSIGVPEATIRALRALLIDPD